MPKGVNSQPALRRRFSTGLDRGVRCRSATTPVRVHPTRVGVMPGVGGTQLNDCEKRDARTGGERERHVLARSEPFCDVRRSRTTERNVFPRSRGATAHRTPARVTITRRDGRPPTARAADAGDQRQSDRDRDRAGAPGQDHRHASREGTRASPSTRSSPAARTSRSASRAGRRSATTRSTGPSRTPGCPPRPDCPSLAEKHRKETDAYFVLVRRPGAPVRVSSRPAEVGNFGDQI